MVTNCGVCGHDQPRHKKGWQADHDHTTGMFRGFLCNACNLRLGYAEKHAIPLSKEERTYLRSHRRDLRLRFNTVVKSPQELAEKATPRQRALHGIRGGRLLPSERWKFEMDARYLADMKQNPEAALFLSQFNEETCTANVYSVGEPHLHTPEEMREIFKDNQAHRRDEDVLSYHRGPSLESVPGLDYAHSAPGDEEDRRIAEIDRKRSLALRGEDA